MKKLLLFLLTAVAGATLQINAAEADLSDQLVEAAWSGDLQEVIKLLNRGVHVDSRNQKEWTALIAAVISDKPAIVELLIMRGADVNKDTKKATPLMISIGTTKHNVAITQLLLQHKANVNICDDRTGGTALMEAAAQGRKDIVKSLLERQADATITTHNGKTAIDFASCKEIKKLLITAGSESTDPQSQAPCCLVS